MKTLDYLHLNEKKVADVVSALHQLLADFQVHYTNLRGFHWDIKGHGFFVLHGKFEDMYNDAAEKVDEIAERILMLGGTPENKFSEYLKVAKVKEISGITCGGEAVEHILETYSYLIGEERKVIELANEAGDDATADLMTGYLKSRKKWFGCSLLSVPELYEIGDKSNKIVGDKVMMHCFVTLLLCYTVIYHLVTPSSF